MDVVVGMVLPPCNAGFEVGFPPYSLLTIVAYCLVNTTGLIKQLNRQVLDLSPVTVQEVVVELNHISF
jgi:hypothetical protein